ncbi:MAG: D-alanyl-D-alanine carboxypeptidase [Lachnospiraceae bacterium]|nr:D-alanyl-D-alanine carboxypeptidase [Lachnospiraceae bacterium]
MNSDSSSYEYDIDPEYLKKRRQVRRERMLRRQRAIRRRIILFAAAVLLIACGIPAAIHFSGKRAERKEQEALLAAEEQQRAEAEAQAQEELLRQQEEAQAQEAAEAAREAEEQARIALYQPQETEATQEIPLSNENVNSTQAILVNADTGEIVARKDDQRVISPASMTKILTLLVACENLTEEDLDDPFTISIEITDFVFRNQCSAVNFDKEETVTVRDLLYGTILPSGADAAMGLAEYVAGSQEAFVDMMNAKVEELGISSTAHFTNCIGLYDEENHCTVRDMAVILRAAVDNEMCREFLSAHTYTTTSTPQHPDGIEISNWFLRRIEDKDTHGEVLYAKTGYVDQSGSCAASFQRSNSGTNYVCVTVNAHSPWRCIYDHVEIYSSYTE